MFDWDRINIEQVTDHQCDTCGMHIVFHHFHKYFCFMSFGWTENNAYSSAFLLFRYIYHLVFFTPSISNTTTVTTRTSTTRITTTTRTTTTTTTTTFYLSKYYKTSPCLLPSFLIPAFSLLYSYTSSLALSLNSFSPSVCIYLQLFPVFSSITAVSEKETSLLIRFYINEHGAYILSSYFNFRILKHSKISSDDNSRVVFLPEAGGSSWDKKCIRSDIIQVVSRNSFGWRKE